MSMMKIMIMVMMMMIIMVMITFSEQYSLKALLCDKTDRVFFFFFQANVVLKEKETFIEYLQKQLNETKSKLDSEVSIACTVCQLPYYAGLSQIQMEFLVSHTGHQMPHIQRKVFKVHFSDSFLAFSKGKFWNI